MWTVMMMARKEKVRLDLDDRIWGIEGTYRGKDEAKGFDYEEPLYYVKYTPASDASGILSKLLAKLGLYAGREEICTTPEPIPKSMIRRQVCPDAGEIPGVPQQKVKLLETKNGDAYYDEHGAAEMARELKRKAQQKQRKDAEARKQGAKRAREEMKDDEAKDLRAAKEMAKVRKDLKDGGEGDG